jgi:hypothetical protein
MGRACARENAPSPSPGLGPCKLFQAQAKHFQICGLFLQGFPKIPLVVLWKLKGLQGEKGNLACSKFLASIRLRKPPSAAGKADVAEGHTRKSVACFSFFRKTELYQETVPGGLHPIGETQPIP